jgi:hypothetical protein
MRSADGLPLLVADAIKTEVETQTRQKPDLLVPAVLAELGISAPQQTQQSTQAV